MPRSKPIKKFIENEKKQEQRYKPDKYYKPEPMHKIPVPGQTFIVTGKEIAGEYKIKRVRAKEKTDIIVFLVEGQRGEFEVSKHNFQRVRG